MMCQTQGQNHVVLSVADMQLVVVAIGMVKQWHLLWVEAT